MKTLFLAAIAALTLLIAGCGDESKPISISEEGGVATGPAGLATNDGQPPSEEKVPCEKCGTPTSVNLLTDVQGKKLCPDCTPKPEAISAGGGGNTPGAGAQRPQTPRPSGNGELGAGALPPPPMPGAEVNCAKCTGHLPKSDAKQIDGKWYCEVCYDEVKAGR